MPELINEKQILEGNNVVEYQLKNFSLKMNKAIKEDIKKLADLCGESAFEGLLLDYQWCSKCKSVWYCSKGIPGLIFNVF